VKREERSDKWKVVSYVDRRNVRGAWCMSISPIASRTKGSDVFTKVSALDINMSKRG